MSHKLPIRGATLAATLRTAWLIYAVLMFLPLLLMTFVMTSYGAARHVNLVEPWFLGTTVFIAVAAPGALFFRSRLFRPYWDGGAVKPRAYLLGMFAIWGTLDAGVLLSIIGCLISHAMLPGILAASVAFLVLAASWPSGKAMLPHGGDSDDPEFYEEPG